MSMPCSKCMAVGAEANIHMYSGQWLLEDDELILHHEARPLCSNCTSGQKVCPTCNCLFPNDEGDTLCPKCEDEDV